MASKSVEAAYNVYKEIVGGKTVNGTPMKAFYDLPDAVQNAWTKASWAGFARFDGEHCFDAYCTALDNKTMDGRPTPEWRDLPPVIREAWDGFSQEAFDRGHSQWGWDSGDMKEDTEERVLKQFAEMSNDQGALGQFIRDTLASGCTISVSPGQGIPLMEWRQEEGSGKIKCTIPPC